MQRAQARFSPPHSRMLRSFRSELVMVAIACLAALLGFQLVLCAGVINGCLALFLRECMARKPAPPDDSLNKQASFRSRVLAARR